MCELQAESCVVLRERYPYLQLMTQHRGLIPNDEHSTRARERLVMAASAFLLITFFALLYALRGGIAALDRGEAVVWSEQVAVSLAVWWACLPLLPLLGLLVKAAPIGRANLAQNSVILLAGTFGAALVRQYVLNPLVTWSTGTPEVSASAFARTLTFFTTFLVWVGLLHAVHYYRDLRKREREAADLARSLAEARLTALRTQLHPHFIFNVLNAIAALLHTDPMMADRMLTRFAALLRFVLQSGVSDEHALRDEVEVLRRYLALMQLRFSDRLHVEWAINSELLDVRVPWMVLQPLVENAIEHGIGDQIETAHLRLAASTESDSLLLTVDDDGVGLVNKQRATLPGEPPRSGVGISNTRERLLQLYGSRASLTLNARPEGGTRAAVRIPLKSRQPSEARV